MENIGKGMSLFRIEDTLRREGVPIDRETLCRIKKMVGDTLARTVVQAMLEHACKTAFCVRRCDRRLTSYWHGAR